MTKNEKSKNSRTSGGVCKLPAGTPSTNKNSKSASRASAPQSNTPEPNTPKSASEDFGEDAPDGSGGRVSNPPVPNRARTEI